MVRGRKIMVLMAVAALAPAPVSSKPKPKAQEARSNALIQALSGCRAISASEARLACYDAASARLAQAVESKDLVVLDRQEIRETRRGLFGFSVPNIPLFRGESGEQESKIEAVIAGASPLEGGKWQIRLEDGAVWQTTETRLNLSDPRRGQKIVIQRGTLGNYFLRINGQRGIRGRRLA